MAKEVKIGASIMCANLLSLQDQINALNMAGIDYLHIDIMDGKFVDNFGLNTDVIKFIKDISSTPIHSHLMILDPEKHIPLFVNAGCECVTIHQESTLHISESIQIVKDCGAKVFVAINPSTSISSIENLLPVIDGILVMTVNPGFAGQPLVPDTINKVRNLSKLLIELGLNIDIQTDGHVSLNTIPLMVQAGATMLVGGSSSLFSKEMSITYALKAMRAAAERHT